MMQTQSGSAAAKTNLAFDLKLPPMPQTLSEILQIRSQAHPDIDRLIDVVEKDPAITASVLRRVNSAFYGVSRKISQVNKAITLLGFKEVCGLVLTAAVKQAFAFKDAEEAKEVYQHMMKTSMAGAAYARHLSNHIGLMMPETAFTAGLLHQLGRIVLLYSTPKGYTQLWVKEEQSHPAPPSLAREHLVFNTTYVRLGAALTTHWALPEELSTAIEFHRDPKSVEKPHLRLVTYVVAAGVAAGQQLYEPETSGEGIPAAVTALAQNRNLDPQELQAFLEAKRDEVHEFTQFMMQN